MPASFSRCSSLRTTFQNVFNQFCCRQRAVAQELSMNLYLIPNEWFLLFAHPLGISTILFWECLVRSCSSLPTSCTRKSSEASFVCSAQLCERILSSIPVIQSSLRIYSKEDSSIDPTILQGWDLHILYEQWMISNGNSSAFWSFELFVIFVSLFRHWT